MLTRNQIWLFATLFVSLCKLNLMAACNPPDQSDCCVIIPSNGCSRLGEFVLPTPEPKCVYLPSDNAPLEVCVGVSPITTINGRILKIKRKVPSFPGANCESSEQIQEIDERHTFTTTWIASGPNMVTNGLGNPACFTVTNTGIYTVTFTVTMEEQCVTNPVKTVDAQVNVGVIDLDIDSDHSNGDFGPANGDAAEDAIEDDFPGESPNEGHKYVLVNNYHNANGYVPGYANFSLEAPLAPAYIAFTPLTVKVQPCDPTTEAGQNLYVTFTYSDSDPNNITSNRMITGDWEWPVPQGDLRLWTKDITQERNPASILDGGDFIPAGVRIPAEQLDLPGEKIIFIEGIRPAYELGASEIKLNVESENAALCDTCFDIVRCTPIQVNVDIDNFNDSGYAAVVHEYFGEDHYEDYIDGTNHIGRVIVVNDGNCDMDTLPDFADGYGLMGLPGSTVCTNSQFLPIRFEIPYPIDLKRARVKLSYSASDPLGVTTNELGDFLLPDDGKLRIWTKDCNKRRNGKSVIAGGDFLDVGEYSATEFGFTNEIRTLVYYVEAVCCSETLGDIRILFEVQPDERAGFMAADAVRMTAVRLGLTPDFDRNGKIGANDKRLLLRNRRFPWWINDDVDIGNCADHGGSDIPGNTTLPDHANSKVNERRDLLDLCVVMLDTECLEPLLDAGYDLQLRQDDDAVNVVYTQLNDSNAGYYLNHNLANCGQNLNMMAHNALKQPVTSEGVSLPAPFRGWLRKHQGKGVFLMEGAFNSKAPLWVDLVKENKILGKTVMHLRIAPVEEMYIRVNLRNGTAAINQGSAMPRANGKHAIFLHGFNVNQNDARGWHAEVFKRLWQSGSNARFHAVTWRGDIRVLNSIGVAAFHYHENVVSAFNTAPHLKNYLEQLPSEKIVMAHSLGNMVVSAAIADHDMYIKKYFMLNAAVASEAYDAGLWRDSSDMSNRIVHDEWRDYTNACWCAKWHEFFVSDPYDSRRNLTWKKRFETVPARTDLYNFYSGGNTVNDDDGDEVFELRNGTPITATYPMGRYAWHKQETHKGLSAIDPAGTSWAGWGFERDSLGNRIYPFPLVANNAPRVLLRDIPVFIHKPIIMFGRNISRDDRNKLLALAIPALSSAAGNTKLRSLPNDNQQNMNFAFKRDDYAWGRYHDDYKERWLHSDMKDMAYFYTYKLFNKLVKEGKLE